MSGRRVALQVGCSVYEDPEIPELSAPAKDVEALEGVLADPAIGNFTVRSLLNKPSEMVREEIEGFFAGSEPDDLLLLYFSCHGYLDARERLYFVATTGNLTDIAGWLASAWYSWGRWPSGCWGGREWVIKRVYGSDANMTNTLARQVNPRDPGVLAGMKGLLPYAGNEMFAKRLLETNPGLQDLTYAAQSYDAVVITALAAAVAGTDEPAAIAREINGVTKTGEKCASFASCMTLVKERKDIDYDGASGPLEFTDPGEPGSITYVINEIQTDGTVKPLSSERARS